MSLYEFLFFIFRRVSAGVLGPSTTTTTTRSIHHNSNLPPTQAGWGPRIPWFWVPPVVGFTVVAYIQLKHMWKRNKIEYGDGEGNKWFMFAPWQVELFTMIPTRWMSRCWGSMCNTYIPEVLRKPLFDTYGSWFNCNLEEAVVSDVTTYKTFNEYFVRKLQPGARYIDPKSTLVSPADATVTSLGEMSYGDLKLDQIKGISYPLDVFTGPRHPFLKGLDKCFSDSPPSGISTNTSEDFKIFYLSVYLAPGDYHWFHSPTEWTVEHRRHIPGHLFSVDPRVLRKINGIFNFNERVLLSGHWQHGLFLYAAIGAYNVGSIKLNSKREKGFQTNCKNMDVKFKDRLYGAGELHQRGDSLGGFELGSSLVLVFTAPKDFKFNIVPGQKLKYGQPVGHVSESSDSSNDVR